VAFFSGEGSDDVTNGLPDAGDCPPLGFAQHVLEFGERLLDWVEIRAVVHRPPPDHVWNRASDKVRREIVEMALDIPELSHCELAVRFTDTKHYFVSESSVYGLLKRHDLVTSPAFIVMKAADEFKDKTTAINQLWQTNFTYLRVIGWGWFYLSTILDDFSRYIIAWRLCTTMKTTDVTEALNMALQASACDDRRVLHQPRLLIDNGSNYISAERASWLGENGMDQTCGTPMHPQTQGKIERWRQTLKNRILFENYYLPGDFEQKIAAFVSHYNHVRYHESIANLTPADVYFGRAQPILKQENGSKTRHSKIDACIITGKPLKTNPRCARSSIQSGSTMSIFV
jgi:putative transposase